MPWAHKPHKKEPKDSRDADGDKGSGVGSRGRSVHRLGNSNHRLVGSHRSIFSPGEDPKLGRWKSVDQVLGR